MILLSYAKSVLRSRSRTEKRAKFLEEGILPRHFPWLCLWEWKWFTNSIKNSIQSTKPPRISNCSIRDIPNSVLGNQSSLMVDR
mmetsp:Transcript_136/g.333  ORF Transcript_136/g.333 Transcript_136/m.333 type:complete len:84 (+) Transcript_136:383-634(+)